ncbi:hypothetical protein [uncultured Dysgonomonas sp.]|jgi:hypothetical protein|uniref:Uncharacterized protein n=1 Tax=uncultured Dysgonomonas sp. TaxID=206096 RepID=A0A212J8P3_9BACT|nr:hypothetical protein [uncultured Dysgonomonas sp.]SBV95575.1 conserved hypothetical protein [uncultured Dysgonomonas sp.]
MYRRFLTNNDYLGIISQEALDQMTRGNQNRFIQAEESAEMSITEYLSENFEIEKELAKGKYIAEYESQITYPVGAHIYVDGQIYEVIRSISGFKTPSDILFWEEHTDLNLIVEKTPCYSQFKTYYPGDIVIYNGDLFKCLHENGYKFNDIRIPLTTGWIEADFEEWQPTDYDVWDVVRFDGVFYALLSLAAFDNNINPFESDNWGAIADYTSNYNEYELSNHEYVVYSGKVFYPEIDVNADIVEIGKHISLHDPRNYNLKKHMVRLAIYELTKLIAPNNISVVRIRDYEDSMKWLSDAAKLKLNPQIPRKLDKEEKPVLDWQLATFQTDYDPNKNPWLT